MAFIDVVEPDDAEGELAEFYERVGDKRGSVANVLKIASLNPSLSHAHLDLYLSIMYNRAAGLTRLQRELIGTVVSWANGCEYCVVHHREAYERYEDDAGKVQAVVDDPRKAPLEPANEALVEYALKLTEQPAAMGPEDVEGLKEHGFSDEDVLAAGAITAYFNFVNRLNLGLGAELEAGAERSYKY